MSTYPQASFSVDETPSADGVRVNLTHTGGDRLPADDLYVQTATSNTSVSQQSNRYGRNATISIGDTITLDDVPNGSRVKLVWIDHRADERSGVLDVYENPRACGDTPSEVVVRTFTVGNERHAPSDQ